MPAISIKVLGSGTSAGVPMIGCHCPVCSSTDPRDRRTRTSIAVAYNGHVVLVDAAPELRLQAVNNYLDVVHAVVFTHAHADHIFGLDDLRRYNTLLHAPLPIYAAPETLASLQRIFSYAFGPRASDNEVYRPELLPQEISGPFDLFGMTWQPIPLIHGRVKVLGFRVGKFAYCTDCSEIPPDSLRQLAGLDTLIIDALRPRVHPAHLNFAQALEVIAQLQPRRAFFTHLSHDVSHVEIEKTLPMNVRVCYDGLQIQVEN
ncbi:MAG TPA: MBL fold metallo-hydrolase [Phycisphaerae bacterium]|nr:MBL fold metallo-hydrolase [Phycisphaerae bacterium]